MKSPLPLAALLSGALLALSPAARGVALAQLDDFQDGTVKNWANGGPAADPLNITTGGPLGLSDNYLQITADGSGSGGKLTSYNRSQWLGNYNAAGVTAIAMDLKGFSSPGSAALSIRFALKTGTGSTPGYVSTAAFSLPIDGLWHHAVFSLSAMTAVGSPGTLASVLSNPGEARILHAAAADTVHGDNIVGQFGVDNIQALPEPTAGGLCAAGLGAFLLRRRARR